MDKWCIKINRVKTFLKGLGQNIKGYNRKYKLILEELETLERLEEGSSLPANLLDKIKKKLSFKVKFSSFLRKKEATGIESQLQLAFKRRQQY